MKPNTLSLNFLALLTNLALLHQAQAVSPPPDGAYPRGNTAEGQSALFSLTSGGYNTAVGYFSLRHDAQGQFNTALGAGTLLANIGDPSTGAGTLNTATGAGALLSNTTGSLNTANGAFALLSNTTGADNTAAGANSLFNNGTGSNNTATGSSALRSNTTGFDDTADGVNALISNNNGSYNTATGVNALFGNTSGSDNTADGVNALASNNGSYNTATGVNALELNTTGSNNTAIGFETLFSNIGGADPEGSNNTAIGTSALFSNVTGFDNTANGVAALYAITTGHDNTAIGYNALVSTTTGTFNVGVGYLAGSNVTTASGVICIANGGSNVDDTCFIGHIRGRTTGNNDAMPVLIDSAGQLGTANSSRRYKTDIKRVNAASESILALKPVSFRYKLHKDMKPQFGLIAEEVAEVNPDLVIYDADRKPYSVRYDAVNTMLLNEFLKEHKAFVEEQHKVEKLQSTVAQQHKDFEAAVAELKGQIQKVSAQLEASKPATHVVNNP